LKDGPYFTGWILFIMFTFFTTIVYMNILIAVVSDEFEKVYDE
jgi:nitrogen fixation protein FixH